MLPPHRKSGNRSCFVRAGRWNLSGGLGILFGLSMAFRLNPADDDVDDINSTACSSGGQAESGIGVTLSASGRSPTI